LALSKKGGLDNALYTKISLETDIEGILEKYKDSLTAVCDKSFHVRKQREKPIGHKSVPWWTLELTIMRKKINAMRCYQRTRGDDNRRENRKRQYQQQKRKYAAMVRKSKMLSWKQYYDTMTLNPWNAVYKLATGNIKKCSTLSTFKKPNRTTTKDLAEMLRAIVKEPITEDDAPFTT
jgi:hypothetical protein